MAAAFHDAISPLLTPLGIDPEEEPPVVPGLQLVVACRVSDSETGTIRHVLIPIPEGASRRVPVSDVGIASAFVLVEDVVAHHADELFPGEEVLATTCFRVTRNGDIAVQEEDANDWRARWKKCWRRKYSDTVRLELPASLPRDLAKVIQGV